MATRVPRTFHFVYGLQPQDEPFPLPFYLALRSCLTVNRPDAVLVHLLHEPWGRYWDLIRPELVVVPAGLAPEVLAHEYDEDLVPERFRYAHHADFVRLDALLEHGGVYTDIDTIFVAPVPDELYDQPFVVGREPPVADPRTGRRRPSVGNALLLGEPGAAFARRWPDAMAASLSGWSDHSTLLPHELAVAHPDEVHIEDERTFYTYRSTPEHLRRLFEEDEPDAGAAPTHWAGVCSIHLWSHLWWDVRRTDFSTFHAGLLDEHRIRTVDTTYNRLARPHLPAFDPSWFTEARRRASDGSPVEGAPSS